MVLKTLRWWIITRAAHAPKLVSYEERKNGIRKMLAIARPVHPGEVLREEFLGPLGLSAGAVAKAVEVPRTRIERLRDEQTGVTADTALRLAAYFGTTPDFWLNLQAAYDLATAKKGFTANVKPYQGLPSGPLEAV